eukprot:scaffold2858_cov659-Pavlova_lutheri.AAC.174
MEEPKKCTLVHKLEGSKGSTTAAGRSLDEQGKAYDGRSAKGRRMARNLYSMERRDRSDAAASSPGGGVVSISSSRLRSHASSHWGFFT